MQISSQSASTSSMKCEVRKMVSPCAFSSANVFQTSRRALASSPVVSSSRKTSSGLGSSASTMNSRWRSPPERLLTGLCSLSPMPKRAQSAR